MLILVDLAHPSDPSILLTKRSESVETHKGQVSFPGGFFEPTDNDTLNTALREFEEEIGAPRSVVDVLGCLDVVHTHQRVPIVPWIGIAREPFECRHNSKEVDRVIFLPVNRLLKDGLSPVSVQLSIGRVSSLGIEVEGEIVWGATARILNQLRDALLK